MKKIIVIASLMFLTACSPTASIISSTKLKVVMPDNSMYKCEVLRNYPAYKQLTDSQVAKLIVQLYKNNVECKNSIDAIKRFLTESKASIESNR